MTTDPIGIEGGINLYLYAKGNPVKYVDSNGQFVHLIVGGAIGGIAGLIGAMNDPCATNGSLFRCAFFGALFGVAGAAVPIGGTIFAAASRNALAGAAGNTAGQFIGGGPFSGRQVVAQGVVGAISGGVGNLVAINTGVGLISATSQGVGTTAAIGAGAVPNLVMPANAGGLRPSGGGGDNCGCNP